MTAYTAAYTAKKKRNLKNNRQIAALDFVGGKRIWLSPFQIKIALLYIRNAFFHSIVYLSVCDKIIGRFFYRRQ